MIRIIPGRQKSTGDLCDDVSVEEGRVDPPDGLGGPGELGDAGVLVHGGHLDGGDAHVAADAEGDDEADAHQPSLEKVNKCCVTMILYTGCSKTFVLH